MNKLRQIAENLAISEATLKNWIKTGIISQKEIDANSIIELRKILEQKQIVKLKSRANKIASTKKIIPKEYFTNFENYSRFLEYLNLLDIHFASKEIENKLFITSICISKGSYFAVKNNSLEQVLEDLKNKSLKKQNNLEKELINWHGEINYKYLPEHEIFFDFNFPLEKDFLGILYQSLKTEGEKSQKGSYYTPEKIVDEIVGDYVQSNFKVLDPACGSGQFLLSFAKIISNPEKIYGYDIDKIAVRIARINLILYYKDFVFVPQIYLSDFLLEKKQKIESNFDFIATNPPWGVHFSNEQKDKLIKNYPATSSKESTSYFISRSIDILRQQGKMSFIIPISILNVKSHQDIRNEILNNCTILRIKNYNQIFKGVYTEVVRIDLQKSKSKQNIIEIENKNKKLEIYQNRFEQSIHKAFLINTSNKDFELLDKIYSVPHTNLKNQSKFALGIVTGNNEFFLSHKAQKGYEAIYTGKEINKFNLSNPRKFINFIPDEMQQVSAEKYFRYDEKLIYKFISKDLVFAFNNSKSLTLNSANILIPQIVGIDIKIVLALFNSSLYNFIFQKKFNSLKVLRYHIEDFPIPILTESQKNDLIKLSNLLIYNKINISELNYYIYKLFELKSSEIKYFNNF